MKGNIKKKLRERPTREFNVSELMGNTGSPCHNTRSLSDFKIKSNLHNIIKQKEEKCADVARSKANESKKLVSKLSVLKRPLG